MGRNKLKLARARKPLIPPDPSPSMQDWGTDYEYAPILKDRELHRTIMVNAGEEFIDLQAEVAVPTSPKADNFVIGGTDAAKVIAQNSSRFIVFEPSIRSSLAGTTLSLTVTASNSYGTSSTVNLTVKIPANADCRFCSFETGVDSNNGQSPASAWKYAPGSVGYTGAATTLGAGKVLFFRGHGERHRYSMVTSSSIGCLTHEGTAGNPMVYCGTGWGGRAIFSGSFIVEGWEQATEEDVGGNPHYNKILKTDLTAQGGAMEFYQHLFAGDFMCYPSQTPVPVDIRDFEDPQDPLEQKGMWQATFTNSSGTVPRIYQTPGTDPVTIVDPRITEAFAGNDPYADGSPIVIWGPGNEVSRQVLTGWDSSTDTATVTVTGADINSSNGYGAYGFTHHPVLITKAGQFALSPDRLTLFYWPPNSEATSVSRLNRMASIGQRSNVTYEGFQVEGYSGRDPSIPMGAAFVHSFGLFSSNIIIRDIFVRHMRADSGDGCFIHGQGSGGFGQPIFERVRYEENPRSSGARLGNRVEGVIDGTDVDVVNSSTGKIRDFYVPQFGVGRTVLLLLKANGIHITGLAGFDLTSVHGNFISLYDVAGVETAGYSVHCVEEYNYAYNCERCRTCSVPDTDQDLDRLNHTRRNVYLGSGNVNSTVHLYSGEPGSKMYRNIILGGPGFTGTANTTNINIGNRLEFYNNVTGGISDVPEERANAAYTLRDNLLTVNSIPPGNGTTQIVTGNTVADGAPFKVWNGIITDQFAATLGAGPIGVFHNVQEV